MYRFLLTLMLVLGPLACSNDLTGGGGGSGSGGSGGSGGGTGGSGGGTGGSGAGSGGVGGGTGGVGGGTGGVGGGTGGVGGGTGGTGGVAGSVTQHHNNPSRDGVYVVPGLTRMAAAGMHRDTTFNVTFNGSAA